MRKPNLDPDVEYHYRKGWMANAKGYDTDACPYYYSDLKAYCAWMAGWRDYRRGQSHG